MEITTYLEKTMESELSANVIDLSNPRIRDPRNPNPTIPAALRIVEFLTLIIDLIF